jgi:hypothetical protein
MIVCLFYLIIVKMGESQMGKVTHNKKNGLLIPKCVIEMFFPFFFFMLIQIIFFQCYSKCFHFFSIECFYY